MGAQFVSLLTILIALGSICFLAFIMTKFIGKRSAGMMKSKYMQVIDSLSMGFDKTIFLVKIGEQYVLMSSSVKGFEFICNLESGMVDAMLRENPPERNKDGFAKYFDFFKVNQNAENSGKNNVNDNLQKLRDAFNNNKKQ